MYIPHASGSLRAFLDVPLDTFRTKSVRSAKACVQWRERYIPIAPAEPPWVVTTMSLISAAPASPGFPTFNNFSNMKRGKDEKEITHSQNWHCRK
jgi:hypothetical protein